MATHCDPPKHCDICAQPIGNTFYDARLKTGRWANTCPTCWWDHSNRLLGTGVGQKYVRHEIGGQYTKVAG